MSNNVSDAMKVIGSNPISSISKERLEEVINDALIAEFKDSPYFYEGKYTLSTRISKLDFSGMVVEIGMKVNKVTNHD